MADANPYRFQRRGWRTFHGSPAAGQAPGSAPGAGPVLRREPPSAGPEPDRRMRILVVEDDPASGALLRQLLDQQGECCLCTTGDLGLARFRQALREDRPFDLVVLGLELPDIPGCEVLKNLRGMEQLHGRRGLDDRSRVVVNASSPDLEPLRACLAQEADGYLLKPVQAPAILKLVDRLSRRAAA